MRMTTVQTVSAYMAAESVGGGNIVTTGALNSGSITSGFGNINTVLQLLLQQVQLLQVQLLLVVILPEVVLFIKTDQ